MRFSPLLISNLIIKPLRYFFSNYAGEDYKYDDDPTKTKIEVGSFNDLHKIPIQVKPRILVNRGSFAISHSGLSDNLAEGKTLFNTKGLQDNVYQVFISGMASITIEAREEGAVELLTDMVSHFLVWSRPFVMNTQGFKQFAMPLNISPPTLGKEDKEIFQTTLNVPYMMEEHWNVKSDALKLNEFYLTVTLA
jgi:hypothetical protein